MSEPIDVIGHIKAIEGRIYIIDEDGHRRQAEIGEPILATDRLDTSSGRVHIQPVQVNFVHNEDLALQPGIEIITPHTPLDSPTKQAEQQTHNTPSPQVSVSPTQPEEESLSSAEIKDSEVLHGETRDALENQRHHEAAEAFAIEQPPQETPQAEDVAPQQGNREKIDLTHHENAPLDNLLSQSVVKTPEVRRSTQTDLSTKGILGADGFGVGQDAQTNVRSLSPNDFALIEELISGNTKLGFNVLRAFDVDTTKIDALIHVNEADDFEEYDPDLKGDQHTIPNLSIPDNTPETPSNIPAALRGRSEVTGEYREHGLTESRLTSKHYDQVVSEQYALQIPTGSAVSSVLASSDPQAQLQFTVTKGVDVYLIPGAGFFNIDTKNTTITDGITTYRDSQNTVLYTIEEKTAGQNTFTFTQNSLLANKAVAEQDLANITASNSYTAGFQTILTNLQSDLSTVSLAEFETKVLSLRDEIQSTANTLSASNTATKEAEENIHLKFYRSLTDLSVLLEKNPPDVTTALTKTIADLQTTWRHTTEQLDAAHRALTNSLNGQNLVLITDKNIPITFDLNGQQTDITIDPYANGIYRTDNAFTADISHVLVNGQDDLIKETLNYAFQQLHQKYLDSVQDNPGQSILDYLTNNNFKMILKLGQGAENGKISLPDGTGNSIEVFVSNKTIALQKADIAKAYTTFVQGGNRLEDIEYTNAQEVSYEEILNQINISGGLNEQKQTATAQVATKTALVSTAETAKAVEQTSVDTAQSALTTATTSRTSATTTFKTQLGYSSSLLNDSTNDLPDSNTLLNSFLISTPSETQTALTTAFTTFTNNFTAYKNAEDSYMSKAITASTTQDGLLAKTVDVTVAQHNKTLETKIEGWRKTALDTAENVRSSSKKAAQAIEQTSFDKTQESLDTSQKALNNALREQLSIDHADTILPLHYSAKVTQWNSYINTLEIKKGIALSERDSKQTAKNLAETAAQADPQNDVLAQKWQDAIDAFNFAQTEHDAWNTTVTQAKTDLSSLIAQKDSLVAAEATKAALDLTVPANYLAHKKAQYDLEIFLLESDNQQSEIDATLDPKQTTLTAMKAQLTTLRALLDDSSLTPALGSKAKMDSTKATVLTEMTDFHSAVETYKNNVLKNNDLNNTNDVVLDPSAVQTADTELTAALKAFSHTATPGGAKEWYDAKLAEYYYLKEKIDLYEADLSYTDTTYPAEISKLVADLTKTVSSARKSFEASEDALALKTQADTLRVDINTDNTYDAGIEAATTSINAALSKIENDITSQNTTISTQQTLFGTENSAAQTATTSLASTQSGFDALRATALSGTTTFFNADLTLTLDTSLTNPASGNYNNTKNPFGQLNTTGSSTGYLDGLLNEAMFTDTLYDNANAYATDMAFYTRELQSSSTAFDSKLDAVFNDATFGLANKTATGLEAKILAQGKEQFEADHALQKLTGQQAQLTKFMEAKTQAQLVETTVQDFKNLELSTAQNLGATTAQTISTYQTTLLAAELQNLTDFKAAIQGIKTTLFNTPGAALDALDHSLNNSTADILDDRIDSISTALSGSGDLSTDLAAITGELTTFTTAVNTYYTDVETAQQALVATAYTNAETAKNTLKTAKTNLLNAIENDLANPASGELLADINTHGRVDADSGFSTSVLTSIQGLAGWPNYVTQFNAYVTAHQDYTTKLTGYFDALQTMTTELAKVKDLASDVETFVEWVQSYDKLTSHAESLKVTADNAKTAIDASTAATNPALYDSTELTTADKVNLTLSIDVEFIEHDASKETHTAIWELPTQFQNINVVASSLPSGTTFSTNASGTKVLTRVWRGEDELNLERWQEQAVFTIARSDFLNITENTLDFQYKVTSTETNTHNTLNSSHSTTTTLTSQDKTLNNTTLIKEGHTTSTDTNLTDLKNSHEAASFSIKGILDKLQAKIDFFNRAFLTQLDEDDVNFAPDQAAYDQAVAELFSNSSFSFTLKDKDHTSTAQLYIKELRASLPATPTDSDIQALITQKQGFEIDVNTYLSGLTLNSSSKVTVTGNKGDLLFVNGVAVNQVNNTWTLTESLLTTLKSGLHKIDYIPKKYSLDDIALTVTGEHNTQVTALENKVVDIVSAQATTLTLDTNVNQSVFTKDETQFDTTGQITFKLDGAALEQKFKNKATSEDIFLSSGTKYSATDIVVTTTDTVSGETTTANAQTVIFDGIAQGVNGAVTATTLKDTGGVNPAFTISANTVTYQQNVSFSVLDDDGSETFTILTKIPDIDNSGSLLKLFAIPGITSDMISAKWSDNAHQDIPISLVNIGGVDYFQSTLKTIDTSFQGTLDISLSAAAFDILRSNSYNTLVSKTDVYSTENVSPNDGEFYTRDNKSSITSSGTLTITPLPLNSYGVSERQNNTIQGHQVKLLEVLGYDTTIQNNANSTIKSIYENSFTQFSTKTQTYDNLDEITKKSLDEFNITVTVERKDSSLSEFQLGLPDASIISSTFDTTTNLATFTLTGKDFYSLINGHTSTNPHSVTFMAKEFEAGSAIFKTATIAYTPSSGSAGSYTTNNIDTTISVAPLNSQLTADGITLSGIDRVVKFGGYVLETTIRGQFLDTSGSESSGQMYQMILPNTIEGKSLPGGLNWQLVDAQGNKTSSLIGAQGETIRIITGIDALSGNPTYTLEVSQLPSGTLDVPVTLSYDNAIQSLITDFNPVFTNIGSTQEDSLPDLTRVFRESISFRDAYQQDRGVLPPTFRPSINISELQTTPDTLLNAAKLETIATAGESFVIPVESYISANPDASTYVTITLKGASADGAIALPDGTLLTATSQQNGEATYTITPTLISQNNYPPIYLPKVFSHLDGTMTVTGTSRGITTDIFRDVAVEVDAKASTIDNSQPLKLSGDFGFTTTTRDINTTDLSNTAVEVIGNAKYTFKYTFTLADFDDASQTGSFEVAIDYSPLRSLLPTALQAVFDAQVGIDSSGNNWFLGRDKSGTAESNVNFNQLTHSAKLILTPTITDPNNTNQTIANPNYQKVQNGEVTLTGIPPEIFTYLDKNTTLNFNATIQSSEGSIVSNGTEATGESLADNNSTKTFSTIVSKPEVLTSYENRGATSGDEHQGILKLNSTQQFLHLQQTLENASGTTASKFAGMGLILNFNGFTQNGIKLIHEDGTSIPFSVTAKGNDGFDLVVSGSALESIHSKFLSDYGSFVQSDPAPTAAEIAAFNYPLRIVTTEDGSGSVQVIAESQLGDSSSRLSGKAHPVLVNPVAAYDTSLETSSKVTYLPKDPANPSAGFSEDLELTIALQNIKITDQNNKMTVFLELADGITNINNVNLRLPTGSRWELVSDNQNKTIGARLVGDSGDINTLLTQQDVNPLRLYANFKNTKEALDQFDSTLNSYTLDRNAFIKNVTITSQVVDNLGNPTYFSNIDTTVTNAQSYYADKLAYNGSEATTFLLNAIKSSLNITTEPTLAQITDYVTTHQSSIQLVIPDLTAGTNILVPPSSVGNEAVYTSNGLLLNKTVLINYLDAVSKSAQPEQTATLLITEATYNPATIIPTVTVTNNSVQTSIPDVPLTYAENKGVSQPNITKSLEYESGSKIVEHHTNHEMNLGNMWYKLLNEVDLTLADSAHSATKAVLTFPGLQPGSQVSFQILDIIDPNTNPFPEDALKNYRIDVNNPKNILFDVVASGDTQHAPRDSSDTLTTPHVVIPYEVIKVMLPYLETKSPETNFNFDLVSINPTVNSDSNFTKSFDVKADKITLNFTGLEDGSTVAIQTATGTTNLVVTSNTVDIGNELLEQVYAFNGLKTSQLFDAGFATVIPAANSNENYSQALSVDVTGQRIHQENLVTVPSSLYNLNDKATIDITGIITETEALLKTFLENPNKSFNDFFSDHSTTTVINGQSVTESFKSHTFKLHLVNIQAGAKVQTAAGEFIVDSQGQISITGQQYRTLYELGKNAINDDNSNSPLQISISDNKKSFVSHFELLDSQESVITPTTNSSLYKQTFFNVIPVASGIDYNKITFEIDRSSGISYGPQDSVNEQGTVTLNLKALLKDAEEANPNAIIEIHSHNKLNMDFDTAGTIWTTIADPNIDGIRTTVAQLSGSEKLTWKFNIAELANLTKNVADHTSRGNVFDESNQFKPEFTVVVRTSESATSILNDPSLPVDQSHSVLEQRLTLAPSLENSITALSVDRNTFDNVESDFRSLILDPGKYLAGDSMHSTEDTSAYSRQVIKYSLLETFKKIEEAVKSNDGIISNPNDSSMRVISQSTLGNILTQGVGLPDEPIAKLEFGFSNNLDVDLLLNDPNIVDKTINLGSPVNAQTGVDNSQNATGSLTAVALRQYFNEYYNKSNKIINLYDEITKIASIGDYHNTDQNLDSSTVHFNAADIVIGGLNANISNALFLPQNDGTTKAISTDAHGRIILTGTDLKSFHEAILAAGTEGYNAASLKLQDAATPANFTYPPPIYANQKTHVDLVHLVEHLADTTTYLNNTTLSDYADTSKLGGATHDFMITLGGFRAGAVVKLYTDGVGTTYSFTADGSGQIIIGNDSTGNQANQQGANQAFADFVKLVSSNSGSAQLRNAIFIDDTNIDSTSSANYLMSDATPSNTGNTVNPVTFQVDSSGLPTSLFKHNYQLTYVPTEPVEAVYLKPVNNTTTNFNVDVTLKLNSDQNITTLEEVSLQKNLPVLINDVPPIDIAIEKAISGFNVTASNFSRTAPDMINGGDRDINNYVNFDLGSGMSTINANQKIYQVIYEFSGPILAQTTLNDPNLSINGNRLIYTNTAPGTDSIDFTGTPEQLKIHLRDLQAAVLPNGTLNTNLIKPVVSVVLFDSAGTPDLSDDNLLRATPIDVDAFATINNSSTVLVEFHETNTEVDNNPNTTLSEINGSDDQSNIIYGQSTVKTTPGAADTNPKTTTLRGGNQNDYLVANYDADSGSEIQIHGKGGNDAILGGGGREVIYGGSGNDTIRAGAGNDYTDGGTGDDIIYGEEGVDVIDGGAGNDTIRGGSGNDAGTLGAAGLLGNTGNDTLYGESGDDIAAGQAGDDRIEGGSGRDKLYGGDVNNAVNSGKDILIGGGDFDILYAQDGADYLQGNILTANRSNNLLFAGDGNDQVSGSVISVGDIANANNSAAWVFQDLPSHTTQGNWGTDFYNADNRPVTGGGGGGGAVQNSWAFFHVYQKFDAFGNNADSHQFMFNKGHEWSTGIHRNHEDAKLLYGGENDYYDIANLGRGQDRFNSQGNGDIVNLTTSSLTVTNSIAGSGDGERDSLVHDLSLKNNNNLFDIVYGFEVGVDKIYIKNLNGVDNSSDNQAYFDNFEKIHQKSYSFEVDAQDNTLRFKTGARDGNLAGTQLEYTQQDGSFVSRTIVDADAEGTAIYFHDKASGNQYNIAFLMGVTANQIDYNQLFVIGDPSAPDSGDPWTSA